MGWGIVIGILLGIAISGGILLGIYKLKQHGGSI